MRDEMERKGLISPGFPGRCTCGSGATGAHLRGAAARLSRPARSRFVPLFERQGFNPEAISMQSHEAIAVRAQPSAPAALFRAETFDRGRVGANLATAHSSRRSLVRLEF